MVRLMPVKSFIGYTVEEREMSNPTEVVFAWLFDTQLKAEAKLLEQVRLHGGERYYTLYMHFEV